MTNRDPDTLRLYASILRKPVSSAASCSGRGSLVQTLHREPGEIISAAADALEFQATAIETGERLRDELLVSHEFLRTTMQRKPRRR